MAAVTYPAGLPCPQTSTVTPAERRALSSADRPREARNIQRDRLDYERIVWPPMTIAETDELLTWWRVTLIYGGAWFVATWPLPRGTVAAVRKLRQQPKWEFVPGGFWRLSALCEVRGRGMDPAAEPGALPLCDGGFRESFDGGAPDYIITGGGVFSFNSNDTYGPSLSIVGGPITSFGSSAFRDITTIAMSHLTFKVRLDAMATGSSEHNTDDGPIFDLRADTDSVFLFDSAREYFYDTSQRPFVFFQGDSSGVNVWPAALTTGLWYDATLELVSPGNWSFTLREQGTGSTHSTPLSGPGPIDVDRLLFYDSFSFGGSDTKPSATYDQIDICP